jgi:hypothetical protein
MIKKILERVVVVATKNNEDFFMLNKTKRVLEIIRNFQHLKRG